MAKVLLILLSAALITAFDMPKMSMEEMMKVFAEIEDENSVKLTSSNYKEELTKNSDPWFIFFHEPRSEKSILKNPVWLIFSDKVKELGWKLNIGKVDLSQEEELAIVFRVHKFPMFMYYEAGAAYEYNGETDPEDFETAVNEKRYLQYNRRVIRLEDGKDYLKEFKAQFVKYPEWVMGALFVGTLVVVKVVEKIFCRSKPKTKVD